MSNKVLNLDISKDPKFNPIIYGRVGDGENQRVTIIATGRDEQIDLTGWTITFEGETSGGKTKVFDSDNIVSASEGLKKGTFDYIFPNMAFAVAGKYERAYFSFIKGNVRDTTGDIKIIVLGNADIDAPEAETIITEYNKLVEELRKLQDQAISEMNQNFAATEAKIAALEKQLSDTQSELQQALKDFENGNFWKKDESFNKEQSSANVIDLVVGKENISMTLALDLSLKKVGSLIENKNMALGGNFSDIAVPTQQGWGEVLQTSYDYLGKLDGTAYWSAANGDSLRKELLLSWDVLAAFKAYFKEDFFVKQGLTSVTQQVNFIRKVTKEIKGSVWGFGSSPSGNKLTMSTRRINHNDPQWTYIASNPSNSIKQISSTIPATSAYAYISDDGKVFNNAYAEPASSAVNSILNIDYARLEITFEISLKDYFDSLMATNHVQNLATQTEAEAGVDELKTMTPKRVFQAIAKWTSNKFISLAGNDTILGIKNFTGNLLINSKRVLTVDDIVQASGTVPIGNGNTGTLKYRKQLNIVTLTFNSLNGRGGGSPSGSLITTLPAELMPSAYFEELIASTDRSTVNTAAISLGSNGEIRWQRNANTASDYSFDVTYQTN